MSFAQYLNTAFDTLIAKISDLKATKSDNSHDHNNIYVSKSDLNAPFNPPSLDGNGMIRSHQIPQSAMPLKQVADIATRDALTNLPSPCQVYVVDASADGVTGGAYYLYTSENGYVKTSNAGDVQLEVDYLDIKNKPLVFTPDVHYHSEYVSKNDKSSYLKNIKINNQLATVIDNVANITIDVQQVTTSAGNVDLSLYAFKTHHHDDLYARYDYLLDQAGKFKADLMPKITISDTFDVNNQVQMLGLACEKGDMARRMDFTPPKMYVLQGDNPAVLSNWIELTVSTDITATINSQKGIAGGLASLGADGKVPLSQLPPLGSSSSNGGSITVTTQTTQLLMHFNGNDGDTTFADEYGHTFTKTGNAKLSATQSKFGSTSLYIPDATSKITCSKSSLNSLNGSKNYTVSVFIYVSQAMPTLSLIWGCGVSTSPFHTGLFLYNTNGLYFGIGGNDFSVTNVITLNKWVHLAVVSNNGDISVFVDGFLVKTATGFSSFNLSTYDLSIGNSADNVYPLTGCYIDELRITTSTTSTVFNVPTAEYSS